MAIRTEAPRRAPERATSTAPVGERQQPGATETNPAGAVDFAPRFLGFLIPAIISTMGGHGAGIGSAVGGAVGGSGGAKVGGQVGGLLQSLFGGGRDATSASADEEASRALEQYQLTQVVTQLMQDCTPAIIEGLQFQLQEQASRGEGDELDDNATERFWGALVPIIGEVCVKYGPAAIKKATKMIGGYVGGRDIDSYEPLLVDTEINQRFVLPSLSAVLSAVQMCLPQLVEVLTGKRESPRDSGISWNDLTNTKRLWDNDNIAVLAMTPIDNQEEIEIVLELAPHKSWWKGIQVQDDNGSVITELGVQDRTKIASTRVRAAQILSPGGYLLFMKAKMFGVHTGMYRLATAGLDQLRGQRVTFYWYAD